MFLVVVFVCLFPQYTGLFLAQVPPWRYCAVTPPPPPKKKKKKNLGMFLAFVCLFPQYPGLFLAQT